MPSGNTHTVKSPRGPESCSKLRRFTKSSKLCTQDPLSWRILKLLQCDIKREHRQWQYCYFRTIISRSIPQLKHENFKRDMAMRPIFRFFFINRLGRGPLHNSKSLRIFIFEFENRKSTPRYQRYGESSGKHSLFILLSKPCRSIAHRFVFRPDVQENQA